MDDLRRLTVKVLLALLVFQSGVNVIDDLWFENRYQPSVEIYALLGGLIGGLFTPEIIGRNGKKKEAAYDGTQANTQSEDIPGRG